MGILQSCQNSDTRMSISLDGSFIRNNNSSIPRYSPSHFTFQNSKVKLFGDIFYKKHLNKTQFVLQTNFMNKNTQVISHSLKIYQDSAKFIHQRGNKMKIVNIITDPNSNFGNNNIGNNSSSLIYTVKLNKNANVNISQPQYLLKTVPFNRYQQQTFKKILYQIAQNQKVMTNSSSFSIGGSSENNNNLPCNQPSPFSYNFYDAFVIQSGIDKDQNDKCVVLIGDQGMASLHQIITYRKLVQNPWSQKQFQVLCYQLLRGLNQLHQKNIMHRDIRPSNIYYSPIKKSYIIGGFGNALSFGSISNNSNNNMNSSNNQRTSSIQNIGINLAGVPYYMPKHLSKIGQKQDFSQYYNYNGFHLDIYALGVTLMNALFLDQFMPVQVLKESLNKYSQKYPFLNLIKQMINIHIGQIDIAQENQMIKDPFNSKKRDSGNGSSNSNSTPISSPQTISQILRSFPRPSQLIIDESSNIQSLRYKLKPQDQQFVQRKKQIAQGYYNMFMYDQWVQQINQVVNYYQLNQDNLQLSQIYKQIADIYSQHHQNQMMEEYYSRACKIYLKISEDCLNDKKSQQAIKYLQKGIDCNRKGFKGMANMDLAFLLNKLAMVHHAKSQYEVARAFQEQSLQITAKVMGQNSSNYAQMLIDCAKIESQFQQFKQAQNMLKAGLKIIQKKQQTSDNLKIKARLLQSLGSNFRMKAIERRDKCDVYRKKAQENLLDALQITEKLQGSIHPQVGSILLNLGNVYFDRRQFDKAKKSYQRALMIKQHSLKSRYNIQVGQCLTYLANSQKFLQQYQNAIRHYDQAIQVFRKAYGNDHNQNTAVAIGNLGLVYKQIGKKNEEREYLSLAKTILKDLYGEQCPDYQYFDRQMSK